MDNSIYTTINVIHIHLQLILVSPGEGSYVISGSSNDVMLSDVMRTLALATKPSIQQLTENDAKCR